MGHALEGATLTRASFRILLALSDGPKHGYAIMRESRTQTGGGAPLGPATLYRSIARLRDDGLIAEVDASRPADTRRRQYELSGAGRAAVQAETVRLAELVERATAKGVLAPRFLGAPA